MPPESHMMGYLPPLMTASLSPAAANARGAAINANYSSYHIPVKPHSVVNQGKLPCCVSCAISVAMEVIHPEWPSLAPLFHYYVTRYDNGGADPDGFLVLDSAIATLTDQGICRLNLHPLPYTIDAAAKKPSPEAYADGLNRRLLRKGFFFQYEQCLETSRVAWIRERLRKNFPVVVGLRLPNSYPDKFLDNTFSWQDPEPSRFSPGSGHCVVVLGYDDLRYALRIQDSLGKGRFDGGCWWLGYRVVDSSMVQEVYSLAP
jgi:hypothetical protein